MAGIRNFGNDVDIIVDGGKYEATKSRILTRFQDSEKMSLRLFFQEQNVQDKRPFHYLQDFFKFMCIIVNTNYRTAIGVL